MVESELLPVLGDGSGRIVLCASTCDPDRIAALGQRAGTRGLRLLETPVSGSSGQVGRGEGVGLIGGDPQVAAAVEPVLRAMFPTYFHIGKIGDGGRAKLAVNLILGPQPLGAGRGTGIRRAARARSRRPFSRSRASRPPIRRSWTSKVRRWCAASSSAEGRVTQHLKDVHLMLEQAERVKQRLPLLEVHADVLEACVRHGEGDLDNSAVIEEIGRRTLP